METNTSIASEIDAIIQRAMAEYNNAKGIDAFAEEPEESVIREEPEPTPVEPIIPQNSSSILVEETTSRFSSAIWYDNIKAKRVTLAGLGGIGSYVGFLLARLHPTMIALYDDDTVETANMSGQLYGMNDVGQPKAIALYHIMEEFADYRTIFTFTERFTENSPATDIMICGFDNMAARQTYFNSWIEHVRSLPETDRCKCLFIDGRLAAENFQVLCLKGDDIFSIGKYERNFLFSDREAEETVCSYKQTTFMANMIGSIMVNLFVNFCANECDPLIPRDLPFYTEYNAETMYFKVIA